MREVAKGVTQARLAELLGEKKHRVNAILNGNQRVPEDFLIKFLEVFKVDANWLLLGVGEPPSPKLTPREAALLDNFRHCDEVGQSAMLTTGAALAQPKLKNAG